MGTSSPKVLLTGVYQENTGYGKAAREYAHALVEAGADLYCWPIYFTPCRDSEVLKKFEYRPCPNPDVILQIIPPYAQEWVGPARNVGLFFTETTPLPNTWAQKASLMDLQLSPSHAQVGWCQASRCWNVPSTVIPVPCDPDKYSRSYPRPTNLPSGKFLFYTIGDLAPRKNLVGLLRAYFAEFYSYEDVCLVIRAGIPGASPEVVESTIRGLIQTVVTQGKFQQVPSVHIIPERLSDEYVMGLHSHCDCFVQLSYGEGWNIPAFDAMGHGKSPIVSASGGQLDFINSDNGYLIPVREEPVFGEGETHAELFTGKCSWWAPDLLGARRAMRNAFLDGVSRNRKAEAGMARVDEFARPLVGAKLMEALCGQETGAKLAGTS